MPGAKHSPLAYRSNGPPERPFTTRFTTFMPRFYINKGPRGHLQQLLQFQHAKLASAV
jgi:hypothetical protein